MLSCCRDAIGMPCCAGITTMAIVGEYVPCSEVGK
jgi:hypothetical protein